MEQVVRVCACVSEKMEMLLAQVTNDSQQDGPLCHHLPSLLLSTLSPSPLPSLPPSSFLSSKNEALDTHSCRHWDGKSSRR